MLNPVRIYFRNDEIEKIIFHILTNSNLIISGPPSTGKTFIIRQLFDQAKLCYNDTYFIYHDCESQPSMQQIFNTIAKHVGIPFNKKVYTVSFDRILKEIIEKQRKKRTYLCLDKIEILIDKYKKYNELLYYFADESLFRLVLVTRRLFREWEFGIRTLSRLCLVNIFFKPYTKKEQNFILGLQRS